MDNARFHKKVDHTRSTDVFPRGGLRGGLTTLLLSKIYILRYNGSLERQALLIVIASMYIENIHNASSVIMYKRNDHEKNS